MKVCTGIGFLILMLSSAAWPQNPMLLKTGNKQANVATAEDLLLARPLGAENIDHVIAGLSDEHVRRLLLNELKAQARREAQTATDKPKPTGIAGFIEKIKNLTTLLQVRIEYLQSGSSAAPGEISVLFAFLGTGERGTKTVASVMLSVAAVLAAALIIEWLFIIYTAAARRRISSTRPDKWSAKIGVLTMRALLDLAAIVIFIAAALIVFFVFLDRTAGQRILLATYMTVLVIVQAAFLVSRFFLAPRLPALRFLPFNDETALYLHRWLIALTAVGSFGTLTCGIIRLAGASELEHFRSITMVGLIMAAMIIWMILQKRKAAAAAFSRGSAGIRPALPPDPKVASLCYSCGRAAAGFFDHQPDCWVSRRARVG